MNMKPDLPPHIMGGDSTEFNFHISSINLMNGEEISFTQAGVTAIVGANNVGKSTIIKEIDRLLASQPNSATVGLQLVKRVRLNNSPNLPNLAAWLSERFSYAAAGSNHGFVNMAHTSPLAWGIIEYLTSGFSTGNLGQLSTFFVSTADASTRISYVDSFPLRESFDSPPVQPIQHLQDSESKMQEFIAYSKRVFGLSLTLDGLSGNSQFRVGEPSIAAPPVNAVTSEYRRELAKLPPLSQQGDGVKSLLGLLMALVSGQAPVIFIDEPEAYLHPPQASVLGKILGEIAHRRGIQVIIATHDKNLLSGLVASNAPVSVVRVSRQEDRSAARQLQPSDIRSIWQDPVLRYSNIMEGLFHKIVVLVEGDQDCKFYSAALDYLCEFSDQGISPDDVLFVPSGGKTGMPRMAKSLRALDVPVVAAPDMDVFTDAGQLKSLVREFGGDWSHLDALNRKIRAQFANPKSPRLVSSVLTSIQAVLAGHETERYAGVHKRNVENELHAEKPWDEVKKHGVDAFQGESRVALDLFLPIISEIGIVPIYDGELESYARSTGVSKGVEWLPAALRANAHQEDAVQKQVARILQSGLRLMRSLVERAASEVES